MELRVGYKRNFFSLVCIISSCLFITPSFAQYSPFYGTYGPSSGYYYNNNMYSPFNSFYPNYGQNRGGYPQSGYPGWNTYPPYSGYSYGQPLYNQPYYSPSYGNSYTGGYPNYTGVGGYSNYTGAGGYSNYTGYPNFNAYPNYGRYGQAMYGPSTMAYSYPFYNDPTSYLPTGFGNPLIGNNWMYQQYAEADVTLNEYDNGDSVTIKQGERLSIILPLKTTTPVLDSDPLDEEILESLGAQFLHGPNFMTNVAAGLPVNYQSDYGSTTQWMFEAKDPGTTTIRLEYKDYLGNAVTDTYEIEVTVEED